ncbi:phage protease [Azotobacter bryophylli]|uniref:Phage protease n=1 Tax=Azotobacter bryophylli TaxID=1986537 RepID=A0ABV7B063_9GAMM
MKTKALSQTTAFAACTFEVQADGSAIQLFPAGAFRARDGRPKEVSAWLIDAEIAAQVIAKVAARATDVVIDYEHQTLNSAENGLPAPAAGWFHALEWREGSGLFATDVRWTERARAMIDAGEYRYLSPVFSYDPQTGAVLDLHHVGLTNYPALDGMASLPALAAARFDPAAAGAASAKGAPRVDKEQLIALLDLSSDASEEDIQTALTALKADAGKTEDLKQALAAAKAEHKPDPAQYVPIDVVEDLKKDIAALKTHQVAGEVEQLVQAGLSDGRLLPAQEGWARELGQSNLAALKGYLEKTPAIAALKGQQTGGKQPDAPSKVEELDAEALAVCKAMGIKPDDYIATLKA